MKEECCREKMLQSAWGPTERFLCDGDSDRRDHDMTTTRGQRQFVLTSSWLDDATFRRRGYRTR